MRTRLRVLLSAVLVAAGFGLAVQRGEAAPTAEQLAPKLRTFVSDGQNFTQSGNSNAVVVGAARTGELAVGDVTGDSVNDVVIGASDGSVYIRPSAGSPSSFTPFSGYAGALFVAVGNLDGDAAAEIVAAMGHGASATYRIFNADGSAVATAVMPYAADFTGGIRVAVGNVTGDAASEVITVAGPGGAAHVREYSAAGDALNQFIGFSPDFAGGAFPAAGNLDGDGLDEILLGPGASANWRLPAAYDGDGTAVALVGRTPGPLGNQADERVAIGVVNGVQSYADTLRHGSDAEVDTFAVSDGAFQRADPPDADGALSVAIAGGKVLTLDTGPRMIMLSAPTLLEHTRNHVTLYGGGLDVLAQKSVTLGTPPNTLDVEATPSGNDDLVFELPIPAFVESGSARMSLGGGDDPRQIFKDNFLSIQSHDPPLDAFVTTGVVREGGPHVRTFTADGPVGGGFMAGPSNVLSGARVARGDLDNDGRDEFVVGAGPGSPPTVRTFGVNQGQITQFNAYDAGFQGGIFVAVGDVDGDGVNDIITGADSGGGPHVRAFSASGQPIGGFMAYDPAFHGGVRVAVGDVDGDGVNDIITAPGPGGGPHVRAFTTDGTALAGFMAYAQSFTGGVYVAAADLDGDGADEIVTGAGPGGGPHVRVFLPEGDEVVGFMAYDGGFTGGVSVGSVGDDIIGPDLIVTGAGPGGGPHVKVFDGPEEVDGFMAYDPNFHGGVMVAGGVA